MKVPFLGGAYRSRSADVSSQECINLYYEPPPEGETHDGSLLGTDGGVTFANATRPSVYPGGALEELDDDDLNPVRGAFVYDDATHAGVPGVPASRRLFFVIKNALYEYYTGAADGKPFLRAWSTDLLMPTANNRVTMAGNNVGQLMLAEGSMGLILEGISASKITDPNFVPTDMVTFQDGYFITTEPGTNRFRYSALREGTSWPAENFITTEGRSDTVEAVLSDRRELWAFGDRSVEIYYNSGDANIPWARFQGGYIETGIIAKFTAQKFDNSVAWLTQNDRGGVQVVRAGNNWTPIIISTPEVSYHMQQYVRVDDAFAYVYQYGGHEFYVLTFPTAGATWVYDALTKQWHRRGHVINSELSRERYNCHAFYNNQHLFGDMSNGRVYKLDPNAGYLEEEGWRINLYLADDFTPMDPRIWVKDAATGLSYDTSDGQYYDILLDNGQTHTTWGSYWAPGYTSLSEALPSNASKGNPVVAYYSEPSPIERIRSSQQISAKNEARTFVTQFQIDFEEGVGDGRIWLSYSKDGGATWSNEREQTLGGDGKYTHRVIWRKLGWGRNWRFRVRTWTDNRIAIKGAWAMIDGEPLESE